MIYARRVRTGRSYVIRIQAIGYLTVERTTHVNGALQVVQVFLVPKAWSYYYVGGVEHPLKPRPRLVGVALEKRIGSASERAKLIALAGQFGLQVVERDPDTRANLDEVNGSVLYFEPKDPKALIFSFESRNAHHRLDVAPDFVMHLQGIFAAYKGRVGCVAELGPGRVRIIDGKFLVKFPRRITEEQARAFAQSIRATVLKAADPNAGFWLIEFTDVQNVGRHLGVIAQLVRSRTIASGEPNLLFQIQTHGCPATANPDPYEPCQDYLSRQKVPNAWCYVDEINSGAGHGASGIRVATIDMAMTFNSATASSNHPDVDQSLMGYCYNLEAENGAFCSDSAPPLSGRENHGMASYGIISAKPNNEFGITGIAPSATHVAVELVSIIADTTRYAQTLLWVGGLRPNPPDGKFDLLDPPKAMPLVHIISCSHGFDGMLVPDLVDSALKQLTCTGRDGLGTVIVYSAGNRDVRLETQQELATHPHTIGVANTDISNAKEVRQFREPDPTLGPYASNYSHWIDLCANGEAALSLQADPNADGPLCGGEVRGKGVFRHGGTSAAASMASAAAALVLSINPNLNWKQVRAILCASAEKVDCDNMDANGQWQWRGPAAQFQQPPAACSSLPRGLEWFSEWYGYGRLDVYEAVRLAHMTMPQPPPPCDAS
jgi:hypothetical protein